MWVASSDGPEHNPGVSPLFEANPQQQQKRPIHIGRGACVLALERSDLQIRYGAATQAVVLCGQETSPLRAVAFLHLLRIR